MEGFPIRIADFISLKMFHVKHFEKSEYDGKRIESNFFPRKLFIMKNGKNVSRETFR